MRLEQNSDRDYRWYIWVVLALAVLFYLYEYLLRVIPSVFTRELISTYHLNARSFGNLFALYYYIYAPMQLLVGLLIDRYGPRRMLAMAVFICSLGVILFAHSHVLFVAEVSELLIGLGSAFAFVGVLKLATLWLPTYRFACVTGVIAGIGMLGGIIGDYSLTLMVRQAGWRHVSYTIGVAGIVLTLLIFFFVRDKKTPMQNYQTYSTFKDTFAQARALLRNSQIWINALIACFFYLPITAFAGSWQIPYLKQTLLMSHAQAVIGTSAVFLGWSVGAPLVGWISDTMRQRRLPITFGATIATIVMAYILYVPHISHFTLMVLFFVLGFACSAQIIAFPISRELAQPGMAGTAIALTNMIVMLSGVFVYFIGAALEGLHNVHKLAQIPAYSLADYQWALLVLPLGLLLTVFLTFFLHETYAFNTSAQDL